MLHNTKKALVRKDIRIAFYGVLLLALGVGLCRFLYTPMLPAMLGEHIFTFPQLAWLASANYAGYLVGSLVFSWSGFHRPHSQHMVFIFATLSVVLLFAMWGVTQISLALAVRFLAGVASAALMIFGSVTVLHHTNNHRVTASLFSGVGVGILLGNECVNVGISHHLTSYDLWFGAGLVGLVLLILLVILSPKAIAFTPESQQTQVRKSAVVSWWQLIIIYGLAGFGYIIVATFLPLISHQLSDSTISQHLWSLVGLAIIPGCFFWLLMEYRFGITLSLMFNLILQAVCVLLSLNGHSPLLLILCCLGFGFTFMGTTALVMPLAKKLPVPSGINLMALVTFTYGVGQVCGPLMTGWLHGHADPLRMSIIIGALALFIAALLCLKRSTVI
ncbi:MAG TPA: MFS transporter [Erwinia persicina]|nr:MFS transporter [Erwinia persicina]HBT11969.1 MFS transporter [Erwinia persicina]